MALAQPPITRSGASGPSATTTKAGTLAPATAGRSTAPRSTPVPGRLYFVTTVDAETFVAEYAGPDGAIGVWATGVLSPLRIPAVKIRAWRWIR